MKPRTFLRQIRNELSDLEAEDIGPATDANLNSIEVEINNYLYKTDKRHNRVTKHA